MRADMLQTIHAGECLAPRNRAERRRPKHAANLRPRFVSIDDACSYAAVGRSKFIDDFLPRLRTMRIGRRHLIELSSLNELLDQLTREPEIAG